MFRRIQRVAVHTKPDWKSLECLSQQKENGVINGTNNGASEQMFAYFVSMLNQNNPQAQVTTRDRVSNSDVSDDIGRKAGPQSTWR